MGLYYVLSQILIRDAACVATIQLLSVCPQAEMTVTKFRPLLNAYGYLRTVNKYHPAYDKPNWQRRVMPVSA